LTGLGDLRRNATPGVAAEEVQAVMPVSVRVAGTMVPAEFAGSAAGLAGVNLVRFRVPVALADSPVVTINAAGVESNEVRLHIAGSG
jgi:uncharacterized protein (TIGR03437 family)